MSNNINDLFHQAVIESVVTNMTTNPKVFHQTMLNFFGKELDYQDLISRDKYELIKFSSEFQKNLNLENSPIDVQKMAYLIQDSLSGAGFCAMTDFECKLCGKTETWGNTNTPGICKNCALVMAENIAIGYKNTLKE